MITYFFLAFALLILGVSPRRRLAMGTSQAGGASSSKNGGSSWAGLLARVGPLWARDGPRGGQGRDSLSGNSVEVAADIELLGACLSAGLPLGDAVKAVSEVSQPALAEVWKHVGVLLDMGVPTRRAWEPVRRLEKLTELADLAELSTHSGAVMAQGCHRLAQKMTDSVGDEATARAERAGVLIALPLATCFLPAFFVLGLAPVVISLGSHLL